LARAVSEGVHRWRRRRPVFRPFIGIISRRSQGRTIDRRGDRGRRARVGTVLPKRARTIQSRTGLHGSGQSHVVFDTWKARPSATSSEVASTLDLLALLPPPSRLGTRATTPGWFGERAVPLRSPPPAVVTAH
jgi:hypothetical protein